MYMEKLVWRTEQRIVKDILPYEYNPRKRNEFKQQQLRESIEYFNLVDTPVVNLNNTLISGQRRLESLIEVGRGDELIDVRVPNRLLTDDEVKRYCLLANTHAGEWDLVMLEAQFSDIYKEVLDMPDISADIMSSDMVDTEKVSSEEVVDDEFIDQPKEDSISILGDIYELNSHRVMCGECTTQVTMEKLMNGRIADMIFIDPPYNVPANSIGNLGKAQHEDFKMAAGEMSSGRFSRFLEDVFVELIKHSKDGSIHYVCMDWKHVEELTKAGKVYNEQKNLIIWVKNNGGMGTFYRSQHELIFVYKNGKKKHTNNFGLGANGRYRTNVWEYKGMNTFGQSDRELLGEHPTVKPVKLVADAIIDCSNYGDLILDTFLGSGTTLIAAEQTGRICYGTELAPEYCDLTLKRYIRFMRQYRKPFTIKRNGVELTEDEINKFNS